MDQGKSEVKSPQHEFVFGEKGPNSTPCYTSTVNSNGKRPIFRTEFYATPVAKSGPTRIDYIRTWTGMKLPGAKFTADIAGGGIGEPDVQLFIKSTALRKLSIYVEMYCSPDE